MSINEGRLSIKGEKLSIKWAGLSIKEEKLSNKQEGLSIIETEMAITRGLSINYKELSIK